VVGRTMTCVVHRHISQVTTGSRKRIYLSTHNQWHPTIPAYHLPPNMQTFNMISKILRTVTRHILGLTLYDMMQSSDDFRDVKAALSVRIDWSIELVSTSIWPILYHHLSPLHESMHSFVAASRRGQLSSLHVDPI